MRGVTEQTTTNSESGQHDRVFDRRLLILSLGFFTVIMDATIVNTANPRIGAELHAGFGALQWVLDGYTLVFACLLLTGGSLADRFGARRIFLAGLVLFGVSSLVCGLAGEITTLNLARLVQGLASAMTLPSSLSLIAASFPEARRRARAIGIWGAVGGIAASIGPIAGGLLAGSIGWRWIFLINLPICLLAIVLTRTGIPSPAPNRETGFDLPGQTVLVLSAASLVLGLINGKQGWADLGTLGPILLGLLGIILFGFIEAKVRRPMFPLALLRELGLRGGLLIGGSINFALYGMLFVLTFCFQHARAMSAMTAGLAIAPLVAITLPGSWLSGPAMDRIGKHRVLYTGVGIAGLGCVWLAGTVQDSYTVLLPGMVLLGFGVSFTMPALTATAIQSAPTHRSGLVSGAVNAARQLGSAIGVAVLGSLAGSSAVFTEGASLAAVVCAILLGLSVPIAARTR